MKKVDLTGKLKKEKGYKVAYTTIYLNPPYYGFADLGGMTIGICFVRDTKKGLKSDKKGWTVWYFGMDNSLTKAITNIRSYYKLKVGQQGWKKVKVKHYNLNYANEIINALKST